MANNSIERTERLKAYYEELRKERNQQTYAELEQNKTSENRSERLKAFLAKERDAQKAQNEAQKAAQARTIEAERAAISNAAAQNAALQAQQKQERALEAQEKIKSYYTPTAPKSSVELVKNVNKMVEGAISNPGATIGNALSAVTPDPIEYVAEKTGAGAIQGAAEVVDTLVGAAKGIKNAANASRTGNNDFLNAFRKGYTSHVGADVNAQAAAEQLVNRIDAEHAKQKNNPVNNFFADAGYNLGHMLPTITATSMASGLGAASKLVNIIGGSTTAINSFTAGTREALKNGASEDEALAYGLMSGAIEGVGEYAIGGLYGTGKGIADTLATKAIKQFGKDVTKKAVHPTTRALLNYGKGLIGEGAEEIIQEALDYGARKSTYDKDSKISVKDLAYAGLLGSFMGGVGSIPNVISESAYGVDAIKDYKDLTKSINTLVESGGRETAKTFVQGMRTAWNGQIQAIEANTTYDNEQKEFAAAPYRWMVQESDKLIKTLESPELKEAVRSNPATTETVKGGELTKTEALEKNKNITDEIRNDNTLTTAQKKERIDPIIAENAKINDIDDVRPDSGEFDDAEGIREAMEEIAAEERAEATAKPEEVKAVEEPKAEAVKSEAETAEPVTEAQPLTESAESGTIEADEVPETVTEVSEISETATPETEQPKVETELTEEVAVSEPEMAESAPETEQDISETEQSVPETEQESSTESHFKNDTLDVTTKKHTKTGADLIVGKVGRTLPKEEYAEFLKAVKSAGGYYSKYAGGFVFPNEESLDKMRDFVDVNDMRTAVQETVVEQETQTPEAETVAEAPQEAQETQEVMGETAATEPVAEGETVAEQPQEAVEKAANETPETIDTTKKEAPQLTDEASPDTTSETVTEKTSEDIVPQDAETVKSESNTAASQIANFVADKLANKKTITRNELNAYAEEVYGKKLADGDIDIKDINDRGN